MKNKKLIILLFSIFILALVLRLWAVFSKEEYKKIPSSDASFYNNVAISIVSGHGFSYMGDGEKRVFTTFRTPGYPLFLAGIYAIFGHNYMAVNIIQAVLGALLCIIIWYIARLLYNDMIIALIAAFLTAVYKPFIWGVNYYGGPTYLHTEVFYMFLLSLSILTLLIYIKKMDIKFGIFSGICFGLSILTRPEIFLYIVILFFYMLYIVKFSFKRFITKYVIVYIFIILTVTPWVVRNYMVFGKFIPFSTLGGYMFWSGNNSNARGGWDYAKNYNEIMKKASNLSEYEQDKIYAKEGIISLKNNPKRIPILFVKKILVHWAPFEKRFKIFNLCYAVVLVLGAVGILFFRKSLLMENILLVNFLATTLVAVIICGDPRYRYPYEPYLIIFAALTVNKLLLFCKSKW